MFFAACGVAPLCRPSWRSECALPFSLIFWHTPYICSNSLSQFETLNSHTRARTHTHTHTHTHGSTKKSTLLNSTGGGDIDTRWDLFPNAHRWRCEAFGWEVRTALWICEPFFLCIFFLSGSWLRGNKQSNGLLSLPTFTPVNHFVCVARTVPISADVSTASKQPVGFQKSWIKCFVTKIPAGLFRVYFSVKI